MPSPSPSKSAVQIENLQLRRLIELTENNQYLLAGLLHQSKISNDYNHKLLRTMRLIAISVAPQAIQQLTEIKLMFQIKGEPPMITPGPVTLTKVGQIATAVVLGYDQVGQPFLGEMPPATLTCDDTEGAVVTFDPATGATTAVANGTTNVNAEVTSAEGLVLSDSETVTVAITEPPPPDQVLSSIKVAFLQALPVRR